MNEKKLVHNFKSYLGLENPALKSINEKNGPLQELKPKLLTGELVVGAAHNVVMFTPLSDRDQGKTGSLFVTNYKLSFITPDQSQNEKEVYQQSMLLGTHDVSLSNVGAVWLTDASNPLRRRRLIPFGPMPNKVKGLQMICKNMKVMSFSFKYSPMGQGRTIAVSLIHHAFPKRHSLLFAYDYREPYYPTMPLDMNTFTRPGDWKRELERCECAHWRMACINGPIDSFMSGASETLIVPNSALDYNLIESARHFRSGRVPIWVWGVSAGAALLRSGELLPTEQSGTAESVLLEQVRRSHPKLTAPRVLYLCGNTLAPSANIAWVLPPLPVLQTSYKKLVEICTPPTLRHYWEQDSQFYSSLDNSRWLKYVSSCLIFAETAAQLLRENTTVVLQEGDGVDYSAIVSSLTQILLDPQTRTISGFQSLVQKEWVALGHPFCDRLGHLSSSNPKEDKSQLDCMKLPAPVFLLFLDCCWQLLRQFPTAFQFTETYLVTLWDCSHNQIFDTFIFNCPRDRELAVSKNLILRPVWDWGEQFSEQDLDMFYNPIYVPHILPAKSPRPTSHVMNNLSPAQTSTSSTGHLYPSTGVSSLELWSQCYQRWLSPLDLPGGGDVQYYVHNVAIMQKINLLREELASLPVSALSPQHRYSNGRPEATPPTPEPLPRPIVTAFYPFTASRGVTPSDGLSSLHVSLIDPTDLLDSQSLLNAPD